jgi:hypothetical protein
VGKGAGDGDGRLARRLPGPPGLRGRPREGDGPGAPARARAGALRQRAKGGRLSELTAWLQEREESLLEAIREDLGKERCAEVEAAVERGLRAYRDRMPARVVEQLRRESRARRLLESHGLPRLSLFHLGGDDGGDG